MSYERNQFVQQEKSQRDGAAGTKAKGTRITHDHTVVDRSVDHVQRLVLSAAVASSTYLGAGYLHGIDIGPLCGTVKLFKIKQIA